MNSEQGPCSKSIEQCPPPRPRSPSNELQHLASTISTQAHAHTHTLTHSLKSPPLKAAHLWPALPERREELVALVQLHAAHPVHVGERSGGRPAHACTQAWVRSGWQNWAPWVGAGRRCPRELQRVSGAGRSSRRTEGASKAHGAHQQLRIPRFRTNQFDIEVSCKRDGLIFQIISEASPPHTQNKLRTATHLLCSGCRWCRCWGCAHAPAGTQPWAACASGRSCIQQGREHGACCCVSA